MTSASSIRNSFLEYFAENQHQIVPSAPLVPQDDPTLLFTNAGMVQFKKVFLGEEKRAYKRATTAQKCLRVGGKHNDLENVGHTRRHHTFFEMLGNFSFGDYFKEQAIKLAWDYLTRILSLPKEKLYVSVYEQDDEAVELWKKVAALPDSRIYRLGEKDNFWSMGDVGPCGPCSEILIDQGEEMACGPNCELGVCDCDRYLEIWNLVFMQFNRDQSGNLTPLPKPSIDTGMGLERIAAVCQGVRSNFDSDLFSGLIQAMANMAGIEYKRDNDQDTALRVIADHSRAISFMIADGIIPSNEGRGYVLRRLIRRAFRFGNFLGIDKAFIYKICSRVVQEMGEAFPELYQSNSFIQEVVSREEENFRNTLDKGLNMLEEEFEKLTAQDQNTVPGTTCFKLYDTFGFPVDIIKDIALKKGFQVDEAGFDELMQVQKHRSKAAWSDQEQDPAIMFTDHLKTGLQNKFLGYDTLQVQAKIESMTDTQGQEKQKTAAGEELFIITDVTPFYGESGGQVGDVGWLQSDTGQGEVLYTFKASANLSIHRVKMSSGQLRLEQTVTLSVDEQKRKDTARNHTCTHLLHAALRQILGEHVKQSGSLVSPNRLRFDFTHIQPLSREELEEIENKVNEFILSDIQLQTRIIPFEQARQEGAIGLFTEKYEDQVRIVEIPGVSKELCGGTHLRATGEAGSFHILSEAGIAAGVRRIEAVSGWSSIEHFREMQKIINLGSARLKTSTDNLIQRIQELQDQLKTIKKENEELQAQLASSSSEDLFQKAEEINGIQVLTAKVDIPDGSGINGLRNILDDLRSKLQSGIILLAAENQDKALLVLSVSRDLHARYTAPELIKKVAKEVQGGGGGRPDLAQAGGNDPSGIERSLAKLKELIT